MEIAFDKYAFRDEHEAARTHHNALNLILKSEFATDATNKTPRVVELKAAELITKATLLSPSGNPMRLWEEAGNVKFNPCGTFDANLFHLAVNYLGQTVIDMLWGKALMKNFPTLQSNMWEFDQGEHSILRPVTGKHTLAGRRGIATGERMGIAMKKLHDDVPAKSPTTFTT